MTMRVFLKGEEVKALAGFTGKLKYQGSQEWTEYSIPGLRFCNEKGRWHFMLELGDQIPEVVNELVEEITLRDWFSGARRETGLYAHNSAIAEVGWDDKKINVSASAKKMDDLVELVHKIREGTIRPEKSYEGPQGGLSRTELIAEIERLNDFTRVTISELDIELQSMNESHAKLEAELATLRDVNAYLEDGKSKSLGQLKEVVGTCEKLLLIDHAFRAMRADLNTFYADKTNDPWPFCMKKKMAREIREILEKHVDTSFPHPGFDGLG